MGSTRLDLDGTQGMAEGDPKQAQGVAGGRQVAAAAWVVRDSASPGAGCWVQGWQLPGAGDRDTFGVAAGAVGERAPQPTAGARLL